MRESESKHVFVSYVREDSDAVDDLCSVLEAAQIPYWRDKSALGPGDAWKARIRQAIREGSLVFLALAAVEQATSAGRTDLLKRLTKEMLPDLSRRIELDDLVSQEVQRVMGVLNDPQRVAPPFAGSNNELVVRVAGEAQDLWSLTEPFCASLQVAARWGTPDLLAPWANA